MLLSYEAIHSTGLVGPDLVHLLRFRLQPRYLFHLPLLHRIVFHHARLWCGMEVDLGQLGDNHLGRVTFFRLGWLFGSRLIPGLRSRCDTLRPTGGGL